MAGVTTRLVWDVGTAASIHPRWDVGTQGISIGWESTQIVKKRLQTTDPRSFIVKKFLEAGWSQGSEAVITITWDVGTGHHINPKWDIINRPASFSYSFGWNQTQIVEAPVRIGYSQLGRIRRLLVTGWTPTSIRFKRLGMEWNSTIPVRHTIATTWSQLGRIPSILNAGWEQTHIQFKRFRQTWLNTIIVDKTNRYGWESTQRVPKQLNSFWTLVGQVRKFTRFAWNQTMIRTNQLRIRLAYQQIVYAGTFLRPGSPAVPARPAVEASISVGDQTQIIGTDGTQNGDALTVDDDSIYFLRANGIYVYDRAAPHARRRIIPTPGRGTGLVVNDDGSFYFVPSNNNQVLRLSATGQTLETLTVDAPTRFRHVGMAVVGNTFYLTEGDSGILNIYTRSFTVPNRLERRQVVRPPSGINNSFAFYADDTYYYWLTHAGIFRVTTHDGDLEISQNITARATGLSAFGDTLYIGVENAGPGARGGLVESAPLTITEAQPARPAIPAIPERYVTAFGWPQTHIFRRVLRPFWESTQITRSALVETDPTGPRNATIGTFTDIIDEVFTGISADNRVIYAAHNDTGTLRRYNKTGANRYEEILPRLELDAGNTRPWGVTNDENFVYVAQWNSNQVYQYRKLTIQSRTEAGPLPATVIRLTASRLSNALAREGNRFYLGSSAAGNTVYIYDQNWTQVGTLDFDEIDGNISSFDLDENFYYLGMESPSNVVIVRRADGVVVARSPGLSNGMFVDGDTLYRSTGDRDTTQTATLTFTGALPARLTGIGTVAWNQTQIVEKELRATWNITQIIRRILRPFWESTQVVLGPRVTIKPGEPAVEAKPATPPTGVTFGTVTSRIQGLPAVGAIVADVPNKILYVISRGVFRRYNLDTFTELLPRRNLDPGNTNPFGATHDDTYVYVQQSGSNQAYRYRKSDHQISRQQLHPNDSGSRGMARDADRFYSMPNNNQIFVYDRSWNFQGTININAFGGTLTALHADENFFYIANYNNGRIRVLRKRVPTGGGNITMTTADQVVNTPTLGGGRVNGLDIEGGIAYFTRDPPTLRVFTAPVTFTGGSPAIEGRPAVPAVTAPSVFAWGQLQRIPKTLSPWWESTRIVDKLLQVIWKPDNVAIKGLAFAWASHRSVVKKINSEFEITQLAESKLRTSWVSHFLTVKQLRTTWTVLGRVQKLLIQQWNQDQLQFKLLTMTWNSTLARVKQLVMEWESTASIPRRLIQQWNSTQILHRRLRATWDSTEIVEKRLRTLYTQLGRIEKKLVVEWDITQVLIKRLRMAWQQIFFIGSPTLKVRISRDKVLKARRGEMDVLKTRGVG